MSMRLLTATCLGLALAAPAWTEDTAPDKAAVETAIDQAQELAGLQAAAERSLRPGSLHVRHLRPGHRCPRRPAQGAAGRWTGADQGHGLPAGQQAARWRHLPQGAGPGHLLHLDHLALPGIDQASWMRTRTWSRPPRPTSSAPRSPTARTRAASAMTSRTVRPTRTCPTPPGRCWAWPPAACHRAIRTCRRRCTSSSTAST